MGRRQPGHRASREGILMACHSDPAMPTSKGGRQNKYSEIEVTTWKIDVSNIRAQTGISKLNSENVRIEFSLRGLGRVISTSTLAYGPALQDACYSVVPYLILKGWSLKNAY